MTELRRRLGTSDAVVVGLGAMLGAGVFASFAPAAHAAGGWLPLSLALAAVVAYCNATSSARLAARYPASGGTYVYGRERLGPFWGYLAGWSFVVGKTASCAAMALTFATYAAPGFARPLAVAAVLALTLLNLFGIQRSVQATLIIVAIVLLVLALVIVLSFTSSSSSQVGGSLHPRGVLEGAGLLFFAFAGYARIATLGEEVRDPARTIPRAVNISLAVVLVVYTLVAFAVLAALGPARLAESASPLAEASPAWLSPAVRAGAAVASLGALLALILGVSRTGLAMARDGYLPRTLAVVDPRSAVPRRAELAVGLVVTVLTATADLRGAIGFSAFGVLLYYAIANASCISLTSAPSTPSSRPSAASPTSTPSTPPSRPSAASPPSTASATSPPPRPTPPANAAAPERPSFGLIRFMPYLGLAGCLVLAFALPWRSVLAGAAVVTVGAVWYMYIVRRVRRAS